MYISRILQQQNEDLRRHLAHTTHKMEAMEAEFENRQHYMQTEMGRTRDDLEKMKDKFRRLDPPSVCFVSCTLSFSHCLSLEYPMDVLAQSLCLNQKHAIAQIN